MTDHQRRDEPRTAGNPAPVAMIARRDGTPHSIEPDRFSRPRSFRVGRIAIDARVEGETAAVAVDRRGRPFAWARTRHEGDRAREDRALAALRVRARESRLLVGPPEMRVVSIDDARAPSPDDVREAAAAPAGDAIGWVRVARAQWLGCALAERSLRRLAEPVLSVVGAGVVPTPDQLLLAADLEARAAWVECLAHGVSVVLRPSLDRIETALFPLAGDGDDREALGRARELLSAAGIGGMRVRVLGRSRERIARTLDAAVSGPLPLIRGQPLPEALELAWRAARAESVPSLCSPWLRRRTAEPPIARPSRGRRARVGQQPARPAASPGDQD